MHSVVAVDCQIGQQDTMVSKLKSFMHWEEKSIQCELPSTASSSAMQIELVLG